jgi:hypothetical protein
MFKVLQVCKIQHTLWSSVMTSEMKAAAADVIPRKCGSKYTCESGRRLAVLLEDIRQNQK